MPEVIYGLCAITAFLCAWLLLTAYRKNRTALLFWSGLFFVIQAVNNLLLILDKIVFPSVNLSVVRLTIALFAIVLLLYGLIMRAEAE